MIDRRPGAFSVWFALSLGALFPKLVMLCCYVLCLAGMFLTVTALMVHVPMLVLQHQMLLSVSQAGIANWSLSTPIGWMVYRRVIG